MALKQQLLAALENSRDTALSGQALASRFGVSRNAVWKAINALKEDGYTMDSAPNRGYRLAPNCDRLSEGGIRALLDDAHLAIHVYDSVDSTNTQAKRLLADGFQPPFLVVSEAQTAGRGRQGRSFYSPKGMGLYLTVALPGGQATDRALGVTAYAAVCAAQAIWCATGIQTRIKWVNDLFWEGRKVCGILTEATTDFESGTVISLLVGVGVNLHRSDVPEPLRDIVGFLPCEAPVKNRLAANLAVSLLRYRPEDTAYLTPYREHSMTLNRRVQCRQGEKRICGIAKAIGQDGALLVESDEGETLALRSGEIQLLPDGSPCAP